MTYPETPASTIAVSRHLYLSQLHPDTTEEHLRLTFGSIGPLESVSTWRLPDRKWANGVVHFAWEEDAEKAKLHFHDTMLNVEGLTPTRIRVEYYGRKHLSSRKLRMKNLSPEGTFWVVLGFV